MVRDDCTRALGRVLVAGALVNIALHATNDAINLSII
jgi:hypothetical protein